MKTLFLILTILTSTAWSQDSHLGHQHSPEEECELSGMPSPAGEGLAVSGLAALTELNPDEAYCNGVKKCGEYSCSIKQPACGLEAREAQAIKFYTGSGYRCLNSYIWGGSEDETQGAVDTLNSALSKLPHYNGFVIRGTSLPDSVRDQHVVGTNIVYDAFTSSSSYSGFEGGKDNFLMYSVEGKPIMSLSGIQREYEVLFASGSTFRVISRQEKSSQNFYILRQVVGTETPEQQKAEDKRILELARTEAQKPLNPKPRYEDFAWNCHAVEGEMPTSIEMKSMPARASMFF